MSRYRGPVSGARCGLIIALVATCAACAAGGGPAVRAGSGSPPAAESATSATGGSAWPGVSTTEAAKAAPAELLPPDGKWLTDEEGRKYFVAEVPKVAGHYVWLSEKTVQLAYGEVYEVMDQDEKTFKVKIFQTSQGAASGPAKPTTAEVAAIAATYQSEAGRSDRLTLAPFDRGLPRRGQWRNGFDIADMNGDGHPDIVHGPSRKSGAAPNIFLGDGKGAWRLWREVEYPRAGYDYGDVAVADFNGDGRPDLALAVHLHGLLVLVADGPQSFKLWNGGLPFEVPGQGKSTGAFSSRAIAAADWNGDGRPDLVALGEGPRFPSVSGLEAPPPVPSRGFGLAVYLNNGDGTWTATEEVDKGVRLFGDDLAVADFTGDGRPDAILASNVLREQDILRIGGPGGTWSVASLALRPRAYVQSVAVGDLNGDGRVDLAVGYLAYEGVWHTGIDLYYGQSAGGWKRRVLVAEEGRAGAYALGVGDLDADDRPDVAALTGDGRLWVFRANGSGFFDREESPEVPAFQGGCRGYHIALSDLDGDGTAEIVAGFAGEPSALFAPDRCPEGGALTAWKAQKK